MGCDRILGQGEKGKGKRMRERGNKPSRKPDERFSPERQAELSEKQKSAQSAIVQVLP